MKVKSESEVDQSCPTLSDPMDCSLPGSSVHGIFQARVLEWGAIAFSRAHYNSQHSYICVCVYVCVYVDICVCVCVCIHTDVIIYYKNEYIFKVFSSRL